MPWKSGFIRLGVGFLYTCLQERVRVFNGFNALMFWPQACLQYLYPLWTRFVALQHFLSAIAESGEPDA
jgi:hypothetical protein